MKIAVSQLDGFEVVALANDFVRIAVIPVLGAKVISLRHLPTGREWMWKLQRQPQFWRVPLGTPFDQGPLVGADECLPTIAACSWRGLGLPDHGEVWSKSWELDRAALAEHRIRTWLRLPISPLKVEREISLDGEHGAAGLPAPESVGRAVRVSLGVSPHVPNRAGRPDRASRQLPHGADGGLPRRLPVGRSQRPLALARACAGH